jgi:hypothetical protein
MAKKSLKSSIVLEPDEPELISLSKASKLIRNAFTPDQLRLYAADGSIPGARQVGKGKQWKFIKPMFEKWWIDYRTPKPGEI